MMMQNDIVPGILELSILDQATLGWEQNFNFNLSAFTLKLLSIKHKYLVRDHSQIT